MDRLLLILWLALTLARAAHAGFKSELIEVSVNANTYGSTTVSVPGGYVEEIMLTVPAASATGTVAVLANRPLSGITAITLATNVVTAELVVRPAVDFTDATGGALASDPPRRPLLYGETITMTVTNASATNAIWRAYIKMSEQ